MTSGLQSTDLIVVAARPSVGKTSFASNIAQHVAFREGRSVGFFSLEMSKEQIGFRVLCSEADVDAKKVRDGYASKEAAVRPGHRPGARSRERASSSTTRRARRPGDAGQGAALKREKGLDLLIVDYLQLMAGHGRFDNRTQEVSHDLARPEAPRQGAAGPDHRALAALAPARAAQGRAAQAPARRPARLRLDRAGRRRRGLPLPRGALRQGDTERKGIADVIIAKQRNGPTGDFPLVFLGDHMTFANYAGPGASRPRGAAVLRRVPGCRSPVSG